MDKKTVVWYRPGQQAKALRLELTLENMQKSAAGFRSYRWSLRANGNLASRSSAMRTARTNSSISRSSRCWTTTVIPLTLSSVRAL